MSDDAPTPQDERPLIEIRDLHVRFSKQWVLRGINLSIPRGQTLCLLGESGCGKTVLLKAMIGLVKPTSGQILFDGKDINTLDERELANLRVRYGFLFQGAALFDSYSVYDNVAFPLREHTRQTSKEIDNVVR